jgi:hypothetical protein
MKVLYSGRYSRYQLSTSLLERSAWHTFGAICRSKYVTLDQWYSTGGTRRHLRVYVKFKISIHILFHERWELQKNISFQSELVLFSISSVPYSTQQWNFAAVLVMLIILWSYNNECHLKCLFVSDADNNSNACEYTLLAQWIQFNVFQ